VLGFALAAVACVVCSLLAWQIAEDQLNNRAVAHLTCENFDVDRIDLEWSYRTVRLTSTHARSEAQQIASVLTTGSSDMECLARLGVQADQPVGVRSVQTPFEPTD
jgi:hypothetical protein